MRHLTVRLIIAVFTLIIAITAVAFWLTRRTPRIDKAAVEATPAEALVTCCELIENPDRYYAKSIHVRAVVLGYHELALYDPACKAADKYVRADFDSASRKKLIKGVADLNGAGFKEGNFWAEVVLVGRFERLLEVDRKTNESDSQLADHKYIEYRFRLVVLDVEHVSALAPDMTWPP